MPRRRVDAGKTLKELGSLHLKRRLWDLEQALRAAEKTANDACGTNISLSVDVPSWQAGGTQTGAAGTPLTMWLTGYFPDQSVESICGEFMKAIAETCGEGRKAAVTKKISRVVCRYVGQRQDFKWQSSLKSEQTLDGGTLTLTANSAGNITHYRAPLQKVLALN